MYYIFSQPIKMLEHEDGNITVNILQSDLSNLA